jgi:hypothetical protein
MDRWLENSLDAGISEADFWSMTLAEIERAIASKQRLLKMQAKERATFDYILAALIANGVGSALGGGEGLPDIREVYPTLFVDEIEEAKQEKQKKIDELSALRFRQYANFHNEKINKEVAKAK